MPSFSEVIKDLMKKRGWKTTKLGLKAGVPASTIRVMFKRGSIPRTENLAKLAKAFGMTIDEIMALTKEPSIKVPEETTEELLERARLAMPLRIPVYSEFHAGEEHLEAAEHIYIPRAMAAGKNIEAYIVHGHCLSPKVENGDVVIIDRSLSPEPGDILLCLRDNELVCGRYEQKNGEQYIHNSDEKIKLDECKATAVVIEVIKRLR